MGASKRKSPGGTPSGSACTGNTTNGGAGETPGVVTDVQIAFLVECYLKDHSYRRTLDEFRSEASLVLGPFISEAPSSMMSLRDILNDYILLKERSLAVQQQKAKLDQIFGSLRDLATEYEATSSPSISGREVPAKRKICTPSQVPSPTDVTPSGTKRLRHTSPETQSSGHTALRVLNPNTPPENQRRPAARTPPEKQQRPPPARTRTPSTAPASPEVEIVGALDPPKVPSKRAHLPKFQSSKCKFLDFSSRGDHFSSRTPAKVREAQGQPQVNEIQEAKGLDFSTTMKQPDVHSPPDDVPDEFFNAHQPLSSLDDILAAPLENFTEVMNALLDNEDVTTSSFMNDVDWGGEVPSHNAATGAQVSNTNMASTTKENTPPAQCKEFLSPM